MALIDDDVLLEVSGINRALHIARCTGLDVYSPALRHDSVYSHRWTLHRSHRLSHPVHWVEVMMPFYRGALFMAGASHYAGNVSSWGIDKYLVPTLQQLMAMPNTAIVDAVQASHLRPISSGMKVYRNGLTAAEEAAKMRAHCLALGRRAGAAAGRQRLAPAHLRAAPRCRARGAARPRHRTASARVAGPQHLAFARPPQRPRQPAPVPALNDRLAPIVGGTRVTRPARRRPYPTGENTMLKQIIAAALGLFVATAFAASVDVNKATQAELEAIKGVGPGIATKILDERKKASFKDWGDLVERIKGVGDANAAKLSADGLTVNGAAYKATAMTPAGKTDAKADAKASKADMKADAAAKKEEAKMMKADAKAKKDDAKMVKTADAPAKAATPATPATPAAPASGAMMAKKPAADAKADTAMKAPAMAASAGARSGGRQGVRAGEEVSAAQQRHAARARGLATTPSHREGVFHGSMLRRCGARRRPAMSGPARARLTPVRWSWSAPARRANAAGRAVPSRRSRPRHRAAHRCRPRRARSVRACTAPRTAGSSRAPRRARRRPRPTTPMPRSMARIGAGSACRCLAAMSSRRWLGEITSTSIGRSEVEARASSVSSASVLLMRCRRSTSTASASRKMFDSAWPAICARFG